MQEALMQEASMQEALQTELVRTVRSIAPGEISALSDDECLACLARALEAHDCAQLDEVARLIGRLAVTIE
jgi:hypothetical protein